MTDLISSTANPIAKRIRALADRKTRKREGAFLVEGIQPVWRAAESEWEIEALILAPQLIQQPAVYEMADTLAARGVRVVEVAADLFTRLSDREGPAGVMAIVRSQTIALRQVQVKSDDVWIILHRVHNPGNLGTIMRTADATGCAGVILCGDTTDPFAPAAVKASMGALFVLPLVQEREFDTVREWATGQGVRLMGTSGYADADHWNFTWDEPVAIVLGNEGDGLPDEILAKTDATVRIPMTGTAESLNLGVAAALLMYEAKRHKIS